MLRCVAGCSHILLFIAGARNSGAVVARHNVVSRSSANPWAKRAITLAVAGAMTTASAQRAQLDVPHRRFRVRVPQICARSMAREGLQGGGSDKPMRVLRQNRDDFRIK